MCVLLWRPKVYAVCLPPLLSTLSAEVGSPLDCGALFLHHTCQAFMRVQGTETLMLELMGQVLIH